MKFELVVDMKATKALGIAAIFVKSDVYCSRGFKRLQPLFPGSAD